LLWTGVPASTGIKLDHLKGASHRRSRDALAQAATNMATAWRSASGVISQFPAYIEALRRFSDEYDLGIFDAGHDKLATEAAAAGLVYKPCGAGGGDVGILLGNSNEQLDEFVIGMDTLGCRLLDRELEINGVDWERH
jgi:phosphomevalonate kinase